MIRAIEAVAVGGAFGWMLHRSGLTHYERIVDLYRLRDLTVMKFMFTALATAAVLIEAATTVGLAAGIPTPPTRIAANLIGGVVFGIGMAGAGYCPGTIVAQAGEGRLDAWGPGLLGLLSGALVFNFIEPIVVPALSRIGSLGYLTFGKLLGAAPLLVAIVCAELALLAFAVARRRQRIAPASQ
jgi:hypothetical protein